MGWDLPPGARDVGLAAVELSELRTALDRLATTGDGDAIELAAGALPAILAALRAASADLTAPGDYLAKTSMRTELLPRLIDLLLVTRLARVAPLALVALRFVGIVALERHPRNARRYQRAHVRPTVHWDRIGDLMTDPAGTLGGHYGWGTPDFDPDPLIINLAAIVESVGLPGRVRRLPRRAEELLAGRPVPEADARPALQLVVSVARSLGVGDLDVGVSLYGLRPTAAGGRDGGFGFSPYLRGTAELEHPLTETLAAVFDLEAESEQVENGLAVLLRANTPVELKTGFAGSGTIETLGAGRALAGLRYGATDAPLTLLDLGGGTVVRADTVSVAAGVVVAGGDATPAAVARIDGGRVVLTLGALDTLLGDLLPKTLELDVDVGAEWSAAGGFSFEGSVGAQMTVPLELHIGPFAVTELQLGVAAGDQLQLAITASGRGRLGPVTVSVARVGMVLALAAREGNLGPADLAVGFRPPAGVALVIEADPVRGGGFIDFDPVSGRYSGGLELVIGELGVAAVGLVETKLPAGGPGYSLLVFLAASFPGIQVGFGLTLNGVTGLVGVHRGVDPDALRAAVPEGGVGALLAPEDPVANAAATIARLEAFFPSHAGAYVVALGLRLRWVELVRLDLAVLVELPGPRRIALLGTARAELVIAGVELLALRLDLLGILEFARAELSIDAALMDSRLLGVLELTGGAAIRASSGPTPYAVLSVGGFHPDFVPEPAVLPVPARVGMSTGSPDSVFYARLDGYFAVTTNTVQFGAHAELRVRAGPFHAEGELGFDALIRFSPFWFTFEFKARFEIGIGGFTLAGARIGGALSGPGPIVFRGKACIELLFFDICWSGTITTGSRVEQPVAAVESVLREMIAEVIPRNVAMADAPRGAAVLAPGTDDEGRPVVHPGGRLRWTQRRAPLGLALERFEGTPLAEPRSVVAVGAVGEVDEWFAPASHANFSDAEAVNLPAFERLPGGVELVPGDTVESAAVAREIGGEEIVLPAEDTRAVAWAANPGWILGGSGADELALVGVAPELWDVHAPDGERRAAGVRRATAQQRGRLTGEVAVPTGDVIPLGGV